ncbi:hypothetical protein GGH96_002500 [Coemansia sp. RSA 1972]|nr:hypothetical protein GGH96_002500 [Coemansia sp. RSA 1972]
MLVQCVFNEPYSAISGGKEKIQPHITKYWKRAVDLEQDMFRPHGQYEFLGFVMTDGVSISAVRELVDEEPGGEKVCKGKCKRKRKQAQPQEPNTELTEKPVGKRKRGRPRKQAQPAQQPAQQNTEPVQPEHQADCTSIHDLSQATLQSTKGRCVLVDPGRRDMLYMMHEDSTIEEKKVYRYTQNQRRVETRRRKYQKICEDEKTAEIVAAERSLNAGSHVVLDLKLFKDHLRARAQVAERLTWFYNRTMCHQQDGATTPKVPMHHKLKLSAFLNHQRADQLLINRLKQKFSRDAVFVIANLYHELVRGTGSWTPPSCPTLLKRGGFPVYLINEYLTSSLCPTCENPVSTFHYVKNPRPYRRTRRPIELCTCSACAA